MFCGFWPPSGCPNRKRRGRCTNTAGEVTVSAFISQFVVAADIDGDGIADMEIQVQAGVAPVEADFIL